MATAGVLGNASAVLAAITSPRPPKNPPTALRGFKWLGPPSHVLTSQAASLAQNPFQISSVPPTALTPQPQAVNPVPTTNVHFASPCNQSSSSSVLGNVSQITPGTGPAPFNSAWNASAFATVPAQPNQPAQVATHPPVRVLMPLPAPSASFTSVANAKHY